MQFARAIVTNNTEGEFDNSIINCGGMIQDICWAPLGSSKLQYLAVAAKKDVESRSHSAFPQIERGIIQIWEIDRSIQDSIAPVMFISHEFGSINQMKFCPLNSYTNLSEEKLKNQFGDKTKNRMGLLAVAFTDGSFRIFSIPFPSEMPNIKDNIFIKLNPILSFKLAKNLSEDALAICLDWSKNIKGNCLLLTGGSSGALACYNLNHIYETNNLDPIFHILQAGYPITSISFNPKDDNQFLFSNSHGNIFFYDLRFPEYPKDIYHPSNNLITSSIWLDHGIFLSQNKSILRFSNKTTDGKFVVSSKFVSNQTIWQISPIKYFPFLALSGYSGEALVCYLDKPKKKQRVIIDQHFMIHSLKLEQHENQDVICISKNIEKRSCFDEKFQLFGPEELSINCICFNSNRGGEGLIASGSSCGILRIQNLKNSINEFKN